MNELNYKNGDLGISSSTGQNPPHKSTSNSIPVHFIAIPAPLPSPENERKERKAKIEQGPMASTSKCYAWHFVELREHRARITAMEAEIVAIQREEKERAFATERKRLLEEVSRLKRRVKEEKEMERRLEEATVAAIAGSGGGETRSC